jgi:type II secretory pathway component GspD/PulD (secretin)
MIFALECPDNENRFKPLKFEQNQIGLEKRAKNMKAKKLVVAMPLGLVLAHLAFAQNSNSLFEPVPGAQTNMVTTSSNQTAGTEAAATDQVVAAVSNQPETTNTMTTTVASNVVTTIVSNEVTTTTATNELSATADTNASNVATTIVSNEVTTTTATNEPSATADTNASNVATTIVSNEVTTTTATNEPSATADTNEVTSAATSSETDTGTAAVAPVTIIPLIQFQDVPITTAIENLARQADINYLLDPKINYGQPDEHGQIIPEPTLSIRWENVTAEQALLALLDNYGLQMVQDPRTKIGRITIKDPTAPVPLITRVVQLKYASVSNIEEAVESTFTDKRSKVVADNRTSQLVVVATDREQTAVDTLIDELDKPTRQVLIETRLIELSSTPSTAKGINWAGTLAAQNVTFGNNVLGGQSGSPYSQTLSSQTPLLGFLGGAIVTNGLINTITYGPNNLVNNPGLLVDTAHGLNPSTAFLNADGVSAVLSFLNQDADAQVVATPRVVTLDNESAHIEVTRATPIFNATAGTQGSPGGSSVSYTNLGTILDVTPHISANDNILLQVAPEVSDIFDTVTKVVAGVENQADEFDFRRVNTQVLIPNSDTLVMGGFIRDNTANSYTKVPFMGDIPIIGYAFRSESKSLEKDNLLIFITPTIVKDSDFQPSTTRFFKSSPVGPAQPMNAKSAWNSAKPHDWSDPGNTDTYLNTIDQQNANGEEMEMNNTPGQ